MHPAPPVTSRPTPAALGTRQPLLWLVTLVCVAVLSLMVSPVPAGAAAIERIFGATSVDTAVLVSQQLYPERASTVFVVNADAVDDAVSSTSLADLLDGPILLTSPEKLTSLTAQEIQRLNPREVMVLGGTRAVSDAVFEELKALGPIVTRISGKNRFETSEQLYREVVSRVDIKEVVLTTDSTATLATAGARGRLTPAILVDPNNPSSVVRDLEVPKIVYQTPDQFSDELLATFKATRKQLGVVGSDTSVQLASLGDRHAVVLVNPQRPVDTLLASRMATKLKADVVLTHQGGFSAQAKQYAQARTLHKVVVVGGPQDVSDDIAAQAFPVVAPAKSDPSRPMIALTYDDGPNPETTQVILDTLTKNGARATFFFLGKMANAYPEMVKKIADAGMELGNHSWDHPQLTKKTADQVTSQLHRTDDIVAQASGGQRPTVFRPPYGAENETVRKIARQPTIMWSVDTLDWKTRSAASTVQSVLTAKDGDIVLMHDIHAPTAEATVQVIPELVKRGYQLVTVSELMAAKGIKMDPDKKYSSAVPKS